MSHFFLTIDGTISSVLNLVYLWIEDDEKRRRKAIDRLYINEKKSRETNDRR